MLTVFRKFVGFTLLEYFLSHPSETTYLNELAKKLHISSRSVKIYCDLFDKEGIIKREIKGNMHLFSTNNEHYRVREMKRAYFINLIAELHIETIAEDGTSIALYGSYASGTYDEKSDIDIVIIGEEYQVKRDLIIQIMERLGKEIQLTVFPFIIWEKMKKNQDAFAQCGEKSCSDKRSSIMNFQECLSKGLLRKDRAASERVQKSVEIAERFVSSSKKNIDIEEFEMAEIASYNAIFHASRSLLFKKHYTERSHVCVIIGLKELYNDNNELLALLNTFDKIRISRHNIQYEGMLVDLDETEFVYDFAVQFLAMVKKII